MGVLRIEMGGSFPYRAKHFGAMEWGHAHAVAEAIAWLSSEVLTAAIAQDHALHESGEQPRLGFGGRPPQNSSPEVDPAHRQAMEDNPGCEPCRRGVGTVAPGPGHKPYTAGHRPHCSGDCCF